MECLYKRHQRHKTLDIWHSYPCGKCLPCRIRKQSAWEFRNRMEFLTSPSSSFLTLTIAPSEMAKWESRPPGDWVRRWLNALRHSERRAGTKAKIRYFGCLEYGDTFGRPHYHMLVYGQMNSWMTPIPRRNGQPSTRYQSPLWPLGHIDAGTITPASIRYCSSYLTKETAQQNILYRTTRPGIGAYGIYSLADTFVKKLGTSLEQPTHFQIGERKFPLDNFMRKHFEIGVQKAGGKIRKLSRTQRTVLRLQTAEAKILANHAETNAQKVLQTERRMLDAQKKAIEKHNEQLRRSEITPDRAYTLGLYPSHQDDAIDQFD